MDSRQVPEDLLTANGLRRAFIDFFVANGEYTITVSAGDTSDSVSMDISRNADYAIGIVNFFGGTFDDSRYTESFASDPQVTLSFTNSAGPGGELVFPVANGYFDIFYFLDTCRLRIKRHGYKFPH